MSGGGGPVIKDASARADYSVPGPTMLEKAVIDYNAFIDQRGEVIIKELAVVDVTTKDVQHWIFKSPQGRGAFEVNEDRKNPFYRNRWLSRNFHGLDFDDGTTPYEELYSALHSLCRNFSVLYAASDDKCVVLERVLERPVFSLKTLGCDHLPRQEILPLPEVLNQCLYHRIYAPGFYCAMTNAVALANWCQENLEKIDLSSASVREKTFVDWPLKRPSPKDMAENGFVAVHFPDPTGSKCVYCSVEMGRWEEGDDVSTDHLRWSPWCKLANSESDLPDVFLI